MSNIAESIQRIAIAFVPLMLGIICHEVAHGYTAYRQGDPTAKNAGRLTLNPIKHLDVTGTLVFIVTAFASPFVIGWAKPVPVDPRNFREPKKGMMLVSIAGPATNIILALLFTALFKVLLVLTPSVAVGSTAASILIPLFEILKYGIIINLVLAVFNLLPIPPLDGSKLLLGVLPRELAIKYLSIERFGFLIIIVLFLVGFMDYVLWPVIVAGYNTLLTIFGIA